MIDLEDNVGDIAGKAQRGLRIADSEVAKKAGDWAIAAARDTGREVEGEYQAHLQTNSKTLFAH